MTNIIRKVVVYSISKRDRVFWWASVMLIGSSLMLQFFIFAIYLDSSSSVAVPPSAIDITPARADLLEDIKKGRITINVRTFSIFGSVLDLSCISMYCLLLGVISFMAMKGSDKKEGKPEVREVQKQ
ncbi:hypothetical protein [Symmachiella dynata]|uniref:hypothetical protein n=1 Tax=Symmachiella dynata TaxID=2527995 RepID=UPI0030EFA22E